MRLRHPRFILFLLSFVLTSGVLALIMPSRLALIAGFDLAAFFYCATMIPLWRSNGPERLRRSAARDDANRVWLLAISSIVNIVMLVMLVMMLREKASMPPVDIAIILLTLVMVWLFGNTVFAMHYAHLYYDRTREGEDTGGLNFPETPKPAFADFFYFSVVLGMTFQVSDVEISSRALRKVATLHGMIAFFYNIGIVALTVNVLAS